MATRKPATKKRTAKLRKAHSHLKASKTRKLRPEVETLLGVKPKATKPTEEPAQETFADVGATTFEKPPANGEHVTTGTADKHTLELHLDMQAIRQDITSSLSPLEKAGCDLMDAVFAHEGLVTDLTNRLASVLKKQPQGIIGHGDRIEIGIPYVDTLNRQISRLEKSNTALRDLIGRIAV
jgi:hypothetical protein